MKFDFEEIKNMIKVSANYSYHILAHEWRAYYVITPSWITEKPLSLEGCKDYDGNEAVYDWMLENGIVMLKLEDGKVQVTFDEVFENIPF